MAITVSSRPDTVSAAYLPTRYVMTSDKMPNTIAAEINQTINNITTVTSTINSIFGGVFEEGDTIIYLQGSITVSLATGEYVKITGNTGAEYDGVHKVKTVYGSSTSGIFTIETTYTIDAAGGSLSKYYKDFSIVSDLYIDSAFAVRMRAQVTGDNNFVFDFSRHLQIYLGSDVETLNATARVQAENTAKPFYIKYAEEYRIPDSNNEPIITTQTLTDDVSNTKVAFNTAIQYVDYRNKEIVSTNYNMNDFTTASSTKRFLTNMPSSVKIGSSEHFFLTLPETIVAGTYVIKVDTYNSSNALIASNNYATYTGVAAYRAYNVPSGTSNLSSVITAATAYYDVYLYNTTFSVQQTEKKRFIINRDCKPLELRFEWLNQLGGMDSYTFIGHQNKQSSIERKQYKRNLNAARVIPERQYTTTQNISTDTFTVNSGRVDYETSEWLQELFNDVETYVIIDGQRLPVQILSDSIDVWNTQGNSYNITFEYRFAYDKITQRN